MSECLKILLAGVTTQKNGDECHENLDLLSPNPVPKFLPVFFVVLLFSAAGCANVPRVI